MKAWLGLMVALMMIAPAHAQVAAWSDPEGDQNVQYGITPDISQEVPNEAGWYPQFDITRAGIYAEDEASLFFELMVQDETASNTEPYSPYLIQYYLHFTYHDEPMRLNIRYYHEWQDEPYATMERLEGEEWDFVAWTDSQPHPDGEGWLFQITKWELRDSYLVPAREGDNIGNIYAYSERSQWDYGGLVGGGLCPDPTSPESMFAGSTSCGFQPSDEAGTESAPLGEYTIAISPEGLGHILLETERPIRASNGLATTYVYSMRLFNLDDEPDVVSLTAANVPSGWDVYLPPRMELEGNEIKDFRMAIGVPFGHKHGEYASLSVVGKSERDPTSMTNTEIAVYWPEIAQPSGHHPRLYFHADGYRRWMNSAQEDPESDQSGVIGAFDFSCNTCVGGDGTLYHSHTYYWFLYLRPGLFTGLDFELEKPAIGNLDIAINENLDTTVTTSLMLFRDEQDDILIGEQEQEVTFRAGESTSVPVSIPINAEADRIPFEDDSWFYFVIFVEGYESDLANWDPTWSTAGVRVGAIADGVSDMDYDGELYASGSFLDLPLLDYHDEIDPGLLDALTRLQLEAPEEIARPVNPGKTAAFFFEVVNKGDTDDTVEWSIEGPRADWASVVPGHSKVQSSGKATVAIRVDVPVDARSSDVADLLLVGQSTKDPEAQVFGNFIAYVEDEADIPDESERFAGLQSTAIETESKGAPFPAGIAFAIIALAALARRRRA